MRFYINCLSLILILLLSLKSMCQTSKNLNQKPILSPNSVVSKIIKNSGLLILNGGHKSGNLYGDAIFNFYDYNSQNPIINVTYTLQDNYGRQMRAREEGMLRNFRFQNNGGAFNTKIILADWGTSTNSKYGKFAFWLHEDKYSIIVQIYNEDANWKHSAFLDITPKEYQDLVNIMTVSGSPINVIKKRYEKQVQDSIETVRKDSILKLEATANPIKIPFHDFYISKKGFHPRLLSWYEAKEMCEKLGKGWRLPRMQDLVAVRNHIMINSDDYRSISMDCNYGYWSSSNFNIDTSQAYYLNICDFDRNQSRFQESLTKQHKLKSEKKYYAIAIWSDQSDVERDSLERVKFIADSTVKALDSLAIINKIISQNESKRLEKENFNKSIIGQPVLLNDIFVAEFDFPNKTNFKKAVEDCKSLGDGWRMPTTEEMNMILKNLEKVNISNFELGAYYWCSDIQKVESGWSGYTYTKGATYSLSVFITTKGKGITYRTDDLEKEFRIRPVKTK